MAATLGCLAASGAMAAPSLCGAGETVLFTCAVGHKIVSICSERGKATYFFGSPGKVEMSSQELSFAETGFSGGGETQVSARNGAYGYIVYDRTTRTSFSADRPNDPAFRSGLVVQKDTRTVSDRACGSDAEFSTDASRLIPSGIFVEH